MNSSGNYNDEGSDINIRGVDSAAGTSRTGIYIDDTPIQTRHVGFGSVNSFPSEELKSAAVLFTVFGGKMVYGHAP